VVAKLVPLGLWLAGAMTGCGRRSGSNPDAKEMPSRRV